MPIQPEKWNSENLPVGPDTDPNDDTPAAVGLSTGGFALTWVRAGLGGALNTVQVRVYDAFGTPATALLTIDSNTSVGVFDPDIAAFPSGNFVVAYRVGVGDISFGVRDVSGGLVLAPTALANSGATESDVALAYHTLDGAPSVLAVWEDSGGEDGAGYAIRGRYILANGAVSGAEFTINAQTAGDQLNPDIAASATGLNAIVWTDMNANSGDIKLRTVTNATGGPEIAEMTVNNSVTGLQDNASVVVLTTGVIVVGWESGTGVYFRVISAAGAFLTPDVLVSASGLDAQFAPTADGGFTIVYRQNGLDGSGGTLRMAAYDSTHTRVGLYITANTTTLNDQEEPDVAMLEDGRHILVFSDESTGTNDDVRYQIIDSRTQTFAGSSGDDTLVGRTTGMTFANDVIYGYEGTDTIYGLTGDDTLFAGSGNDDVFGGAGNDALWGEGGNDTLNGDDGNDAINGDDGADMITGGLGQDVLVGGAGADTLDGGDDIDYVDGGAGADTLYGGAGGDSIVDLSDASANIIFGGAGIDNVLAGAGDDQIFGGDDIDNLFAGAGNDTVDGGAGNDGIFGDFGNDTLNGGSGNDAMNGDDGDDVMDGGLGSDVVVGGAGADTIIGGDGDDALFGGDGVDRFQGGPGVDGLFGGAGNDTFVFDVANAGLDVIFDGQFGAGAGDVIEIQGAPPGTTFAQLLGGQSYQTGTTAVIVWDNTTAIFITNMQLSAFAADDFLFI